ncbi:MAG TPA: hypothetical protein VLE19_11860, partial [Pyrinomonadaceae bacterium]|nr:hypothetical protein [Pyrinomonadaceae bacterium]
MDLLPKSERNRIPAVSTSMRDLFFAWWRRNQLVVSWFLLATPLVTLMAYEALMDTRSLSVVVAPIS